MRGLLDELVTPSEELLDELVTPSEELLDELDEFLLLHDDVLFDDFDWELMLDELLKLDKLVLDEELLFDEEEELLLDELEELEEEE